MIDGVSCGPYELTELVEAGVRPETYVWCKGMADWAQAGEVADICRYFRQRLAGSPGKHAEPTVPGAKRGEDAKRGDGEDSDDPYTDVPERFRYMARRSDTPPDGVRDDSPDTSIPPAPTLFVAVFLTLFCFPLTGFVAIYYSYKARKSWAEASQSSEGQTKALYSEAEREELRRRAHDFDRLAKMWIGITFFLGVILFAVIGNRM